MPSAPHYRVEVWSGLGSGFGPGTMIADFQFAKNVGWADYANDVPEAFFTLAQDDAKISLITTYKRTAHVKIYRNADLVWAGTLGNWRANKKDVVFYAYGYLSETYKLQTAYNVLYSSSQIDTIVTAEWNRLKALTNSRLNWMTTGTIQAPVTVSGGGTAIVLPAYRIFYKRFLMLCRELAALGIGDSNNTVLFEITPSGTFNYWKNRGTDTGIVWEYGDTKIADFSDGTAPVLQRNELLAVGHDPNSGALFVDKLNSTDATAYGLSQEPMFFAWVRDTLEMTRVTDHRAAAALRDNVDLSLRFFPNAVTPPRATGATFGITDRVTVRIDRGVTQVNGKQMIVGYQVLFLHKQERVSVIVQTPLEP